MALKDGLGLLGASRTDLGLGGDVVTFIFLGYLNVWVTTAPFLSGSF